MNQERRWVRCALFVWLLPLVCGAALSACAKPGAQTLFLQFRATGETSPSSGFTVGLVPFQDTRGATQTLGRRLRVDGSWEPIVLGSPSAAKDLTYMLVRFLESRGVRVVELASWRPELDDLKGLPPGIQLAFSGRIEALDVEADSSLLKTTVRFRIHLTAHLGVVDRGEIVTRAWRFAPQRTSVLFDVREVEEQLNKALVESMEGLFQGFLPLS
jgi:hypothetical protein